MIWTNDNLVTTRKWPRCVAQGWWLLCIIMLGVAHSSVINAQVVATDYTLGVGDIVKISVYEQPDLATTAQISVSGQVVMPLAGSISIKGLTTAQAEQSIATRLRMGGFVKQPQVSVTVQEYRSQQVAVLGYVRKPDKYPVEAMSTVLEVLARAGGVAEDAGDVVTIVREATGKKSIFKVNLASFFSGDMSQNIGIVSGDLILVPRMNLYYIYGEVGKPGAYRLERDMTVVQALSVGGGLSDRGTQNGIRIKRQAQSGAVEEIQVGLNDLLQPNDVVYVRESLF